MSTEIKVLETVINTLAKLSEPVIVKLYGSYFKNTLVVVGLQSNTSGENDIVDSFPAEIDFCGIAGSEELLDSQEDIIKTLASVDITDNPVCLTYQPNGGTDKVTVGIVVNENIEETSFTVITEKSLHTEFTYIRVQAELPFTCELTTDCIRNAFINLRMQISNGKMVFNIPQNDLYLLGNGNETLLVNQSGDPKLYNLTNSSDDLTEDTGRKKKTSSCKMTVLSVNMLQRVTRDGSPNTGRNHGPLCILDKKHCKTVNIIIPVDALAMLNKNTRAVKLYEILVETVNRNLRLYERALLNSFKLHVEEPSNMTRLEVYHFYLDNRGHLVTCVFPKNAEGASLYEERKYLHKQFLLPLTRPIFRKGNRYLFQSNNGGPLINPHEGLKTTDNGGEIALVRGKYSYYHYCQDNMDDNGWGCAYRSLQTLASWYILQGYSDKNVPEYKDIQKCLVDIGDKPVSFIGSKQWIGSTEVCFVLNKLLDITSKIMYVSSGEEMAYKGPELLNHFQTHGSPIMIGGGVLAHTILGVDYNNKSGDIKFLILDPHYTGREELSTIQSKGWCGWKGVNFWDKNAYYNMCMPQVPIVI